MLLTVGRCVLATGRALPSRSATGTGTRARVHRMAGMVPCSSAATPPPPPPPPSRSAELQQLWANAYDGWSNVPGANAPAVYLCPSGDTAVASVSEPFPEAVLQSRVFALTAWNPMGERAEPDANRRANLSLEAEVNALSAPEPRCWWRGFGFSAEWREDGFVIAYRETDADEGRNAIVQLASKYKQGAIYEYSPTEEPTQLLRKTVPVLVAETDADQTMVRCEKPALENASR